MSRRHVTRIVRTTCRPWPLALLVVFALAGCGPPPAEATPIPANVVRPQQPTPNYPKNARVFSLATPVATPEFVATAVAQPEESILDAPAAARPDYRRMLPFDLPPSALGVASGGATIYATPGGQAVTSVPVGGIVTITGKSADGQWYAVYANDAVFGWTPAAQLRAFGDEDLTVVDESADPGPVATLVAQSMQPVRVLDMLLAAMTPAAEKARSAALAAAPAVETPTPLPAGAPQAATGTVTSEGRLNVRSRPSIDGAIVVKLGPGTRIAVSGRNGAGDWLQVQTDEGQGWVTAEFVQLDRPVDQIPVTVEP